ncbi:ABC-2 family transporter protein [bacterium]|nr:ABC-2 family transporter protein [bacterium]
MNFRTFSLEFPRHARILIQFWKTSLVQAMEYRVNFMLGIGANAIDFTIGLVQYGFFFSVANSIAGWQKDQMLAFYAIFMTIFSLHFIVLFPNLEAMSQLVNSGALDLVLTKPISVQFLLSFRKLSFDEMGSFFTSQVLLLGLWATGRIDVSAQNLFLFFGALFCSFSFVYSFFLFLMAIAIRIEKLQNMAELMWSFFTFCRYPVDVFPRWVRSLFISLIPIAFITTIPAKALTVGVEPSTVIWGGFLAVVFLFAARFFWKTAIASYTSAGG